MDAPAGPRVREDEALRRITPHGIRQCLGRGGQVGWIDRGATPAAGLRGQRRLVIAGPMQSGKTREAVELMREAVQEGWLPGDRIYEPAPAFRLLAEQGLRAALRQCLGSQAAMLLFVDDLPSHFSGKGLKQLDEAQAALQECPAAYVLATARNDQLTPAHDAWLRQAGFHVVRLRDLDEEETGRLVSDAAGRLELLVDDAARAELVAGRDGTPGWVLAALRCLRAEGVAQVDQAAARRVAQEGGAAAWAEVRRLVQEQVAAAGPLLDSLATFHAAGVAPWAPLVLPYAAHLWRQGHRWRRPWTALAALRRALASPRSRPGTGLAEFDVIVHDGQVSYPDVAVEGLVAPEAARERLGAFLEAHRRRFHNRWLRWLHRDAGLQMQALFDLALAAQERKEWAAANRYYRAALRVRPHPGLYVRRGVALSEQGDLEAAIADYDRAIALEPLDATAYSNRGLARRARGELEAAIADYDRAIALDVQYARAYGNRATARCEQGDLEAAIADYGRAIALARDGGDRAMAYHNRGLAHRARGDLKAAIADYEQAIVLFAGGPERARAYNNRGLVRRAQGDLKAAIANYDQAIDLDPQLAEAYGNRGNARYEQGHLLAAISDYDQAIELNPQLAEAYSNRGNARYEQGHLEAAIADYAQAIELNPQSSYAYVGRGLARYKQGQLEQAIADYSQAIGLEPRYAMAYYNRAMARCERGELEAAIADYDQALTLLPDGPEKARVYRDRGSARKARGDLEAAMADYDQAIGLHPHDATVYYSRGNAHSAQGHLEAAIADYSQAIDLRLGDAMAYYNRGLAYKEQGEKEKAVADLTRFLRLSHNAYWREQAEQQLRELEGE